MTIKEVEGRLEITRANIRFYEKEGLLVPKRNPVNSYREYSEENVETLKKVIFLRKMDVSIDDIRALQIGKQTMEELLAKHSVYLKNKAKEYADTQILCLELIKNTEYDYKKLNVDKYDCEVYKNDYALFKDTISNLAMIKDKIIIWVLIIIAFLNAIFSYFFLPEQIPVEWCGMIVTGSANRIYIFLYPVLSILTVLFIKSIIWNLIYNHMPFYLIYIDCITSGICLCIVIMLLSYQVYTSLYLNGIRWSFECMIIIEILIFMFLLSFYFVFKRRKNEICGNKR